MRIFCKEEILRSLLPPVVFHIIYSHKGRCQWMQIVKFKERQSPLAAHSTYVANAQPYVAHPSISLTLVRSGLVNFFKYLFRRKTPPLKKGRRGEAKLHLSTSFKPADQSQSVGKSSATVWA